MNFKPWLLLNEFNATNIYDFYALELAKSKIDDKEIDDKLIQRGNDLLDQIIDAVGLLLLDRYGDIIKPGYFQDAKKLEKDVNDQLDWQIGVDKKMGKSKPENEIYLKEKTRNILADSMPKLEKYKDILLANNYSRRYYDDIVKEKRTMRKWDNLSPSEKKELVETLVVISKMLGNGLGRNWQKIYDLFMDNIVRPIYDSDQIIRKINQVTQLVHNNGNLLEYMPPALDRAIHYRDVASYSQLLIHASPEVKLLLRSAAMPTKSETAPNHGEMFITAILRGLPAIKKEHNNLFDITNIELVSFEKLPKEEKSHSFWGSLQIDTVIKEKAIYKVYFTIDGSKSKSTISEKNISGSILIECVFKNFHKPIKNVDITTLNKTGKSTIQRASNAMQYVNDFYMSIGGYNPHNDFVKLGTGFVETLALYVEQLLKIQRQIEQSLINR